MQTLIPGPPNGGDPIPAFDAVPRRHRHDGWTPARQQAFIDALAELGSVSAAARRINMAPEGAYYLRRQPGAESFRAAWNAALDHGVQRLIDIAIDRATEGVAVPIFWRGEQVGEKRWFNDRLLMFILKHHQPGRYGASPALREGTKSKALAAIEDEQAWREEMEKADRAAESINRKIAAIRRGFLRRIAPDPAKRAAWELLVGQAPDWDLALAGAPQPQCERDRSQHDPGLVIAWAEGTCSPTKPRGWPEDDGVALDPPARDY